MDRTASAFLLAIVVVGGCARLDYVKVPSPTQYDVWTDEDQQAADNMKGVRYYLPRPFLHVKQSVPVAQRVAFVSFVYQKATTTRPAGYRLQTENAPAWVRRVVPEFLSGEQALAAMSPKQRGPNGELQAGDLGGPNAAKPAEPNTPEPPSTLRSRNSYVNESDPVTRLSPSMDVVYLPDFDEQFVIQVHGGLGKVDVETRLRNGWAAEVFSQKWDNSNLIPYVIEQVEHASEAASGIFTTWAPLFAGFPPAKVPTKTGELQGAELERKVQVLGNLLVFKIAEVRIAQPGIYPILKPREIRDWFYNPNDLARGGSVVRPGDIRAWFGLGGGFTQDDPEGEFSSFLKRSNLPWIRPDMAFVPCPPVTVVGFNVTTDLFFMPVTERLTAEADTNILEDGGGTVDVRDEQQLRTRLHAWFKINASQLEGMTIEDSLPNPSQTPNRQNGYVILYALPIADPDKADSIRETVHKAITAGVPADVDKENLGAILSQDKKSLVLRIPFKDAKTLLASNTWMAAAG